MNLTVYEAIQNRRTIRLFKQTPLLPCDIIKIIDAGRLAPTSANLQPLKYHIITDKTIRQKMHPHIQYAGYLPHWNPSFESTPTAFIAILNDTEIKPTLNSECDSGAAIMNMILQATEIGLGSVWLGAINREEIKKILQLDHRLDITYLLGIGYPNQKGRTVHVTDSIKYYQDETGNMLVPKRSLEDVLV